MDKFEIREDFLMNGKAFKILSGAIHYFRVPRDDWQHSLYNLKALGFNCVETYVPWNLHEAEKGHFDFEGALDLPAFLSLAKDMGLYAIVRPSPYICAEWEFGGFPAWLLQEDCHIRSSDPKYLAHVSAYYDELLPRLVKHQLDHGGNILLFQVENEYGSYGEDKKYLRLLSQMMRDKGLTMPFVTSDGPWKACLRAGSLVEDNILATGNFGSRAAENFRELRNYLEEHGKKWPLMCMEFWDGWFNRWNEPLVTRDKHELVDAVREAISLGSINLYMFHGGTNFAFMNGCSARGNHDLPQVTSYDYGAPLDEQGNPTASYYALQEMMKKDFPEYPTMEPRVKTCLSPRTWSLTGKVNLFSTLDKISQPIHCLYPKTMEELGQGYGYHLYRTHFQKDADQEKLRLIDGRDRAQVFLNGKKVATQYQEEIGQEIVLDLIQEENQLDVLIENMGRVNYGAKLLADTQRKGLRQGVMLDLHFLQNWQQYKLPFTDDSQIDFDGEWTVGQPAFYRFEGDLEEVADAYLDLSEFGKGFVWVNGKNIGRFCQLGPTLSLYVAKGFLKEGRNAIVICETEGIASDVLRFLDKPLLKDMHKGE